MSRKSSSPYKKFLILALIAAASAHFLVPGGITGNKWVAQAKEKVTDAVEQTTGISTDKTREDLQPPEINEISGTVVGIADGDTLTVLSPINGQKTEVKVRLSAVDAPEKAQDYGSRAKEELSSLVFQKKVFVRIIDIDRYNRKIGEVRVSGLTTSVNLEMVKRGYAWHYKQYDKQPVYDAAEKDARLQKKGLWAKPGAIPPWEFRKKKKQS